MLSPAVNLLRSARSPARLFLPFVLASGVVSHQTGCSPQPSGQAILIVVDTLRADHLGLYGYGRPTSPHLDAWSQQAAVFERAIAPSPWTLPSFASMLTGELPSRHGAGSRAHDPDRNSLPGLGDALPTFPEALKAAGFRTGAIVNNPFLLPSVGLHRGFGSYDYKPPSPTYERRASDVVDLALAWIERNREASFFLMLHMMDPHLSYDAPPPFRGRFTAGLPGGFELPVSHSWAIRERAAFVGDEESAFIRAAYDEEVAFVDHELGRFFDTLVKRGLWSRLLVVLTSDHGEELFDRGGFEHGHSVHQEVLHVPLIVWGPGVSVARHGDPVSLVDLPRTLLDGVGVDGWKDSAGQSLWPVLGAERTAPDVRLLIAEGTLYGPERRAAIRWPLKLTLEAGTGRQHLYDLEQDPEERSDLAAQQREATARLRRELGSTLDMPLQGVPPEAAPLDEETVESLRALGYVD